MGNSKWAIVSGNDASGGKYLQKQGGGWYSSSGSGPGIKIPFRSGRTGKYDVWLKAFAPDGGSDSLHVDFHGKASTYHFVGNTLGRWQWIKVRSIDVGYNVPHSLSLWAREDKLKIDSVVIQPAGSGGPSDATSFRQAFHEAAVRLKNQVDQQLRSKNSVYLGDSNYITSVSLKQARDIEGFTVGIDISGFGLHGEFQMSVLMDAENHEFGFSGSLEGGAQNPDLPGAGVFANAVFGDDGLRIESVVSGYSVNANASASIPGLPVGIEVVRSLPVGQGGLGLTETGIRYDITNSSVVPASAGVSHSTSSGWTIDLGPVANAFASGLDAVYGIAAQAQAKWDSLTGSNPSSSGSSGGGSDGNGGGDWSHTSCCYNGETGPRSANKIPQQPSNGVLSIEAELLSTKALDNSKWAVTSQSGASGRILRKQGGGFYSYSGGGPGARLIFNASRSGDHDVWLRAYAPDDGSDSLHIDLDGSASTYHFSRGNLARWAWVKVRTVRLSAGGQHTLTLWAREDNLRIDKMVIQPTGRGAPS